MSLTALYILCRWLHFGALMSLAGAGFYTVLLAPSRYRPHLSGRLRPLMAAASGVTLMSTLLLLTAQTGLMGDGWGDMLSAEVWQAVLNTGFGRVWQWQCLFALCGCLAWLLRGAAGQRLLLLMALLQLAGLAFVGHAAMLDGWAGGVQRVNQMTHLIGAAFWAGGLLPLVVVMREARGVAHRYDAIRTLMRFSRYGHLAVALVVLSGVLNSLLLLGWPPASFRLYSQLLLVKVALVAAMTLIALVNRYWLVPRFQRSGQRAQQLFIRTTLAEIVLAALALLAVSLFATLQPG
ncbi:copper homeostasis membrane protein CopD [Erwinia sp. B116]|uniref:copper homeostasis membrane protein CopD n=1 Tax=Erwinia sp. B116 TaxID=1561024 RepID=UPI000C76F730|nr:copper homeostasis membrane protein CopD [Erwinia sp. B116]PLV61665.1 copper resistance protein CopD [Erwinia sp. B116]